MKATLYHLHALTAIHAGTGQGVGVIDLPIARERATNLPIVPGSGLKGVLREETRPEKGTGEHLLWKALFGPEPDEAEKGEQASAYAGALTVQDALLLCLPVRSVYGTFAWVTSPFVWRRYRRDWCQVMGRDLPQEPIALQENGISVTKASALVSGGQVFLEDLDLTVAHGDVDALADHLASRVFPHDKTWQGYFRERFAVVSDEVFDFLIETATEVRARIRLQPGTRTVAKGALWYEESVLWGVIACERSRHPDRQDSAEALMNAFSSKLLSADEIRLQIGGKATVGLGQVRWLMETPE